MYKVTALIPTPYAVVTGRPWTLPAVERYAKEMLKDSWVAGIKVEGPDCTFIVRRKIT